MRVNNPATMAMVRGIVEGDMPIARVSESVSAYNVAATIAQTPIAEIFEEDRKTVKRASCARKTEKTLRIIAGDSEYEFDGSEDVDAEITGLAPSAWKNGKSGTLVLESAGTYQIYVPAGEGTLPGMGFSEIVHVGRLSETAFGAVHAIAGETASGSMMLCVRDGVIYVYAGEAGVFPNTLCTVNVSARRLFDSSEKHN